MIGSQTHSVQKQPEAKMESESLEGSRSVVPAGKSDSQASPDAAPGVSSAESVAAGDGAISDEAASQWLQSALPLITSEDMVSKKEGVAALRTMLAGRLLIVLCWAHR